VQERQDWACCPQGIAASQLQVLEDATSRATLDDMLAWRDRFHDVHTKIPNYHFSSSAYWLRLTVHNQRAQPVPLFVDVTHTTLDFLTLYVVGADNRRHIVQSGDRLPARQRPYPATTLVLPFQLDANESAELYLRVQAEAASLLVPFAIVDAETLGASIRTERVFHGAILGLFVALFIYNLLSFTLLREPAYCYYAAYLPSAYLYITSLDGFGPAVLYPGATWPGNEGVVFFAGLTFTLILGFTRSFLRTAEYRELDRWLKLMIGLGVFLSATPFILPVRIAYQITFAMTFVFSVHCLVVVGMMRRHRRIEARFYFLDKSSPEAGCCCSGSCSWVSCPTISSCSRALPWAFRQGLFCMPWP
jgi:hypothetical protein